MHPSDGTCSQQAVINQQLTIEGDSGAGWSYSVIASLSEAGTPQLVSYFNNDVYGWTAAVAVRHLALAPSVFVRINVKGDPRSSRKVTRIRNGDAGAAYLAWAESIPYTITVSTSRSGKALATLKGQARNSKAVWRIFHIVGSLKNGLQIVQHDVPPLKS